MRQFFYFWNVFILLTETMRCTSMETPIVSIEMDETGLHRNLVYTVQFDYPLTESECEYVLEQSLPASVYVSVDQLDDLQRLKKLNAIHPKFVDIEVPTEKASAFNVLLKGAAKLIDVIKLPIHFRYHAPSDESSFVTVDIATPTMYMSCPTIDSNLIEGVTRGVRYCLQETDIKFVTYVESNNDNESEFDDCHWKLIDVEYQLKAPLSAKIPVGNAKAFPPILYATIVVSWIISLWTVFRTHNVPRRINYKLEEQRILQKKIK